MTNGAEVLKVSRRIIVSTWESASKHKCDQLPQNVLPAWAVFDATCKTNYHINSPQLIINDIIDCPKCRKRVDKLLDLRVRMGEEIYRHEYPCLINWKKSVRGIGENKDDPTNC